MAEGEFALLRQHLEAGLKTSTSLGTAPGSDHDLYALLADAAAQHHAQAVLPRIRAARRRDGKTH